MLQLTVDDADVGDHPSVGVVHGVEDEGASWRVGLTDWRGDAFDDGVEEIRDAFTGLARDP